MTSKSSKVNTQEKLSLFNQFNIDFRAAERSPASKTRGGAFVRRVYEPGSPRITAGAVHM